MKNRPIELGWNITGSGDGDFQGVLAPIFVKKRWVIFCPFTFFFLSILSRRLGLSVGWVERVEVVGYTFVSYWL